MPKHEELQQYLPKPKPPMGRKMVSVSKLTHKRITELAEELNVSRAKTVEAILNYYLDGEDEVA